MACACQRIGKSRSMKYKLNQRSLMKAAKVGTPVVVGGFGGFVLAEKGGNYVNAMLTEKGKSINEKIIPGIKIGGGILLSGLAWAYGKKGAVTNAIIGSGVGVAVNGGLEIAAQENVFGITGNGMRLVYRKPDRNAEVLNGAIPDNSPTVLNGIGTIGQC